jgi:hypothetical protein
MANNTKKMEEKKKEELIESESPLAIVLRLSFFFHPF